MTAALVSLGATDVKVNPLGIGAWQWGDRMLWGFGREYGEADVRRAFEASLAAGIRFFDTAEVYGRGRSERLVGEFVRASGQLVTVATKYFPFPWRWRKRSLIDALRRSLDRLGLKQIDLYQVHWPFPPRSVKTWASALADAVEAGLARAVASPTSTPIRCVAPMTCWPSGASRWRRIRLNTACCIGNRSGTACWRRAAISAWR